MHITMHITTQNRFMVCSVKPFFSISIFIFMTQKIEMFLIHKIECSESADQYFSLLRNVVPAVLAILWQVCLCCS
jgi:hypothetical protein